MEPKIWIGLVGLVPKKGNTSLGKEIGGAYVNVVGYAFDKEDFQEKVILELEKRNFEMIEIEDIEPYLNRIEHFEVANEIRRISALAQKSKELQFGTFHTFPPEGAN